MKGVEIYSLLTRVEQEAFTTNVQHHYSDPSMLGYLFEKEFYHAGQFICSAFEWSDTPEGFDYWFQISWDIERRVKQIVKYQLPTFKFGGRDG